MSEIDSKRLFNRFLRVFARYRQCDHTTTVVNGLCSVGPTPIGCGYNERLCALVHPGLLMNRCFAKLLTFFALLVAYGLVRPAVAVESIATFTQVYCVSCHAVADPTAMLDIESLGNAIDTGNQSAWESISRRLFTRQMPPPGADQPSDQERSDAELSLNSSLDQFAQLHPTPGRTPTFRRLNRTEYENAIRDLLALNIDATTLLPPDESSDGFDNITVTELSPALMARYVAAAQRISRLAIGSPVDSPSGDTFRVPADLTQDTHIEGLPLGTRGGILIPYTFPISGRYEIQVRLTRDRNEEIEGLRGTHQMDVLVDDERIEQFTLHPPNKKDYASVDGNLKTQFNATAGPHQVGVTFVKQPSVLQETKRQPYDAHFNMHRHARLGPAVFQVSIVGPIDGVAAGTLTPSRVAVFGSEPLGLGKTLEENRLRAITVLSSLAQRAYRRPVSNEDINIPLEFYDEARRRGEGFDSGIEAALSSLLVNPNFLFRIERDPPGVATSIAYAISDIELASRLSFFLWSSLPDDELLDLAANGTLRDEASLANQVRRMLADDRSLNLVTNFSDQWLHLRNLASITPDLRMFPDFDENLREAFRQETLRFVDSVFREDRSVLDLIDADYTFVNERLAKHYGIPHIYGSHFRRITLDAQSQRGGLLRQGSILTATSYATRTSPVIRGHFILKNLMGMAPPPPPPNVPTLPDVTVAGNLSVRNRLAEHRANESCAVCHIVMDPVGFALENFDAVGRWRDSEDGIPIDASGGLPNGSECDGVIGLEQGILEKMPDVFVATLADRLLTFALGRNVEPTDGAAIRQIVRQTLADDYRFSSLVLAIVRSQPFQMRMTP